MYKMLFTCWKQLAVVASPFPLSWSTLCSSPHLQLWVSHKKLLCGVRVPYKLCPRVCRSEMPPLQLSHCKNDRLLTIKTLYEMLSITLKQKEYNVKIYKDEARVMKLEGWISPSVVCQVRCDAVFGTYCHWRHNQSEASCGFTQTTAYEGIIQSCFHHKVRKYLWILRSLTFYLCTLHRRPLDI